MTQVTKDQLNQTYDQLYAEAQALFDKYDPCRIKDGTCISGRMSNRSEQFCCHGCDYVTSKGCRVKALGCKVWICTTVRITASKKFLEKLRDLDGRAMDNNMWLKRMCKRDLLASSWLSRFNEPMPEL